MANVEGRKFAPNIFNKSKCSNCFRLKEDHSASAIELNKASRKISKCGYLFVAPDWDFSNPINRTKRWQRRWFVLYDDGELTYSVDDHPETIPQVVKYKNTKRNATCDPRVRIISQLICIPKDKQLSECAESYAMNCFSDSSCKPAA